VDKTEESILRIMNRYILTNSIATVFLVAILFVSGCSQLTHEENGYLEGVITIGPICPVERIPPDPGCLPTAETYKAYPVNVFTSDGNRKISQLTPSLDGAFRIELPPGKYLVVLESAKSNIGSSNLPAAVSISPLGKTLLNIAIDTGIR
jgi:hypothetical protein